MPSDLSREDFPTLLARLASLDAAAFDEIYRRIRVELMVTARRVLRHFPELRGTYEAEDALDSAMRVMWENLLRGKQNHPGGMDDFLRLARTFISRRIMERVRKARAAKRRPASAQGASPGLRFEGPYVPDDLDIVACDLPPVEVGVEANDLIEWLLSLLDEKRREVARLRLQEKTVKEIVKQLGMPRRTVQRMLAEIQKIWLDATRDD